MNLKNIEIKNKTALAPLSGVNCTSFRLLCKKYGAGLIFTQMYHPNTILQKEKEGELKEFLNIQDEERPVAIQLVGSLKENWEDTIKTIERHAEIIDLNMGCIDTDVLGNKSGCYLSKHPEQAGKIIERCVSSTKKPITAKIRIGWDEKTINAIETAKLLEKNGASAITVHGRTKKQGFMGKADWSIIKQVKESVSIPVIGNGDISLPGHAKAMIEQTGCDMVMVGRAAMKNPMLFDDINYLLENGKNREQSIDKKGLVKEFIQLYNKYEKRKSISEIKHHCMWLISGEKKATEMKVDIGKANSPEEIIKIIGKKY